MCLCCKIKVPLFLLPSIKVPSFSLPSIAARDRNAPKDPVVARVAVRVQLDHRDELARATTPREAIDRAVVDILSAERCSHSHRNSVSTNDLHHGHRCARRLGVGLDEPALVRHRLVLRRPRRAFNVQVVHVDPASGWGVARKLGKGMHHFDVDVRPLQLPRAVHVAPSAAAAGAVPTITAITAGQKKTNERKNEKKLKSSTTVRKRERERDMDM